MKRRRSSQASREERAGPEQLPLDTSPKIRAGVSPEEAAKVAIARRTRPSVVPDHVRLTLTLDLRRALAERLSARAIRTGANLEAIVIELLESGPE
jgi:hypothetical protein